MATILWQLTTRMSYGGKDPKDSWSTGVTVRALDTAGNPDVLAALQTFFDALAAIATSKTYLFGAIATPIVAPGEVNPYKGRFIRPGLASFGLRDIGANPVANKEAVAIFNLPSAYGYPGQLKIRGLFESADLETTADGTYRIADASDYNDLSGDFANAVMTINTANVKLVNPAAEGDDFVTGARLVTDVTEGGVGTKQRSQNKESVDALRKRLARRELIALNEKLERAAEEGTPWTDSLWEAIWNAAVDVVARYGSQLILELPLPYYIRLLAYAAAGALAMPARPALPG